MLKIRYFAVIVSVMLLILPVLGSTAVAGSEGGFTAVLSDFDDCLTDEQENNLRQLMQETANKASCNIGIVITRDLNGMSDVKYADKFGDDVFGTGSSFVVLMLLNTYDNPAYDEYQDRISTSGMGRNKYDGHIGAMLNKMYDGLDSGGFYAACKNFCSVAERYGSGSGGTASLMVDEGLITTVFGGSVIGLIAATIVTIIVVSSVVKGYKKIKPISAANYIDQSRTRITRQVDQFVREYTTSHVVSSSSSGHGGGRHGGGGGSHRSGGHGGGGGRHR
ncbi:MAG: TPM domain-containing protein [Oscillospiraceae bacterium]|nr:TPM domain-containing protein [Oscillospiraceae bacterium]